MAKKKAKIKRNGSVWENPRYKKVSIDHSEGIVAVIKVDGNEVAAVLITFDQLTLTISRDSKQPTKISGFNIIPI